ncbi:hypothetical protein BQ6471_01499 [Vibrio gazogenes]|nr:hypothetical protein BQ6471_01499 [Vibrio gazogenes]
MRNRQKHDGWVLTRLIYYQNTIDSLQKRYQFIMNNIID